MIICPKAPLFVGFISTASTGTLQYSQKNHHRCDLVFAYRGISAEFQFIRGSIVAAIDFTTKTQPFKTTEFFFEETRPPLVMFLAFLATISGKSFPMHLPRNCHQSLWIGIDTILQSFPFEINQLVPFHQELGRGIMSSFPNPRICRYHRISEKSCERAPTSLVFHIEILKSR